MKKKFVRDTLVFLLILGIIGFLCYHHVDGTELPAISGVTGEYTAFVTRTQNQFNNHQSQEYTLSSEQIMAMQELLRTSKFTRYYSNSYSYKGLHDTYSIVLELSDGQGKQVDFIQIFFIEDLYLSISAPYVHQQLMLKVHSDQLDEALDQILLDACTPE